LDEQYKLGQFTLVGHSFGGFVAAHYALKNPHKIEKLILISPLGMT
jgi:cardiolipin-specific phospholipase